MRALGLIGELAEWQRNPRDAEKDLTDSSLYLKISSATRETTDWCKDHMRKMERAEQEAKRARVE